jgi:hypothetical protein
MSYGLILPGGLFKHRDHPAAETETLGKVLKAKEVEVPPSDAIKFPKLEGAFYSSDSPILLETVKATVESCNNNSDRLEELIATLQKAGILAISK